VKHVWNFGNPIYVPKTPNTPNFKILSPKKWSTCFHEQYKVFNYFCSQMILQSFCTSFAISHDATMLTDVLTITIPVHTVCSPVKHMFHPRIQHSAEVRANVRHSFGEPALNFGFGRTS